MSITKEFYGKLPCGCEVYRYTLINKNGMKLRVLNYGGTATELWVPDKNGCFTDIIGGYDCLASYLGGDGYQGALVGRFANRIKDSKFSIDGVEYKVTPTEAGGHQLHGGKVGFNARIWDVTELDGEEPSLKLTLTSYDGEEGFPGKLDITVVYTLTNDNGWKIEYTANTDKPTIINLTNHTYFNLGGYASGSILPTVLQLSADSYIPTDAELIPTGEIRSVEGTPFDFRKAKTIGCDLDCDNNDLLLAGGEFNGYDHCFNFEGGQTQLPVKRGEAYEPTSGRVLELYTNCPCVQLYTGNFLRNKAYPFKGGYAQQVQTLFCLETQCMPDSINHEGFTSCVLRPDETFSRTTEYRFTTK